MQPLLPFSRERAPEWLESIEARVDRVGPRLALEFRLTGALDRLLIPKLSGPPARKHELWKHTCFEAYLAIPGSPGYWELNLSPNGDWTLYRFEGYRAGRTDEVGVTKPQIHLDRSPLGVRGDVPWIFHAELEIAALANVPDGALDLALTAIIEDMNGTLTYWALAHTGPAPDFHRRESFTQRL